MPNCKKKTDLLAQSWSESLQEDLKRATRATTAVLRRQAGIASGVFLIVF